MIFSVLAFFALILSICMKDRKKSLMVQMVNCFLESIYDVIIQAYTGAILSIINVIRTFLFLQKERISKIGYVGILCLFEGIILINCRITWNGMISLFPTIGSMIRTYCLWQSNMKLVRISGITTGILYGIYYAYYHSYVMVLGDFILLLTGIYTFWKYDGKGRKKT